MCMHIYIQNSLTVVDTKFVALATVFTISWLKAGWCFGFCRSSFCFWENNQPSEKPSPNHPLFPPNWGENVHRMMHEFQRVNHFPASTELTRRKIWGETCGVFWCGEVVQYREVLSQGGWEIKLTSDDFLWKDVFCSNFKNDCGNETRIWWNVIEGCVATPFVYFSLINEHTLWPVWRGELQGQHWGVFISVLMQTKTRWWFQIVLFDF